jgi:hypothetical protein
MPKKAIPLGARQSGNPPPQFPPISHFHDPEDVEYVIGPHARLKIARRETSGENPRYLATVRAEDCTLDRMLDEFGGGDYQIHVFDGARYVTSFNVSLDPTVPARDP